MFTISSNVENKRKEWKEKASDVKILHYISAFLQNHVSGAKTYIYNKQ